MCLGLVGEALVQVQVEQVQIQPRPPRPLVVEVRWHLEGAP